MTDFGLYGVLRSAAAALCTTMLLAGPAAALDDAQRWTWVHSTSSKGSKITTPTADRRTVTTKHGAWQVTCDEAGDQRVCTAVFRVIDRKRNATILTWRLGHNSDGELLAEFFVPTEVMIRPGVQLTLGEGEAHTAAYVACGKAACKAILPVDGALAHDLGEAGEAKIAITTSQGKVTQFSMSIDGIGAAMAALAP